MADSSLWIERYRPQTFDDVQGQEAIVSRIKAFVRQKNLPHLLFSGPAGVGKTSLILVIAKTLFGENWRENFLELNASNDRGIDVVRTKIKDFARTMAIGDVPFKIIYLDECDSLTSEAQQALRRTMENYSDNCRFCLSCNYSSKIIDPIQSRCTIFRFRPLGKEAISSIIKKIAKEEGLQVDAALLDTLYDVAGGDVRRAENILQSCASLSKTLNSEMIYEISSAAKPGDLREILLDAVNGNFLKARKLLLEVMLQHGLSGLDVIKQIQREILHLDVDEFVQLRMIQQCGEIEFRMVEGSDEYIQLEALLASFYQKR